MGDHRLAHRADRLRQRGQQVLARGLDALVLGRELARHQVRVAELVALAPGDVGEADRERREPALALLGEHRHDQARVQPAREQDADGHVGDHAPPHGALQRLAHRLRPVLRAPAERSGSRANGGSQ